MPENKDAKVDHFTKKEKWMIGVYIVAAITSTLLFVIMLVMIFQLQSSINASQSSSPAQSGQPSSQTTEMESLRKMLEDVERKLENLENKPAQTEGLQNKFDEIEKNFTKLENKMRNAEKKSKRRATLLLDSWFEATNGLLYRFFRSDKDFADAWTDCQQRGARLASTGFRSASTAINDMWRYTPTNSQTWIGLNKSEGNYQWVWSDRVPYSSVRDWSAPNDLLKRCAFMQWNEFPPSPYFNDLCTRRFSYICETEA